MATASVTPPNTMPSFDPSTHNSISIDGVGVVGFPKSVPMDLQTSWAGKAYELGQRVLNQTSQAGSALSESLGGPSSTSDVPGYLSRSGQALSHPVDSLKTVAKSLSTPSDPALLDAAHDAWKSGNHVESIQHLMGYLTPFIGAGADRAGDELKSDDYGKAIGHTVAAIAPLLFGAPEEFAVTSEADAAAQAARQATISTRSNVPISSTREGVKQQFAKGGEINPNEPTVPVPQRTAGTPTTVAAERAGVIKAPQPLSEVQRSAAATIRRQYAGEPTPLVKDVEPNVGAHILRGSEAEQAIHDFIQKAYPGIGEKPSGVEQVSTPREVSAHEINIGGQTSGAETPAQTAAEADKQKAGAPKVTPRIDTSLPIGKSVAASSASDHFLPKDAAVDRALQPKSQDITAELEQHNASQQATNPKSLVGPAPVKPSLRQLLSSERGELTIPGTSPAPPDVPTFYSKAEKVANEKVPTTASGDQVLATLRNNGVKENEIGWMGLDDYLKGKPKVSKADLQQFIKENQIQLKEVDLGYSDRTRQLAKQRDQAYAENNNIWQHDFKGQDSTSDLINAMNERRDTEPIIAKMPEPLQNKARRFIETDKMIHDLDAELVRVNRNRMPTKYEQYTLPGEKNNYTEKLLTLPEKKSPGRFVVERDNDLYRVKDTSTGQHVVQGNSQRQRFGTGDEYAATDYANSLNRQAGSEPTTIGDKFRSSHFDEPNILAHVRYDDRPALDGKKTLFLEELQSDWHQKGKIEGYQNPAPTKLPDGVYITPDEGRFQVVNREGNPILSRFFGSEQDARAAALSHYGEGAGNSGVPNAPFKSDWHELVMKRMIRHAAENGYDRLAWTTGEQQAGRYDLSKQVSRIQYLPNEKYLRVFDLDGHFMFDKQVEPEHIADYVGKEPARRLLTSPIENSGAQPTQTIEGEGLKVGGEWAKALYDRAIPNFLKGYTKKWDGEVGTTQLKDAVGVNERYDLTETSGGWRLVDKEQNQGNGTFIGPVFKTGGAAEKWLKDQGYLNQKVHSIEITPAMRKSLMKTGQPIARVTAPTATVNG
jgi:hypothetical protein